MQRQLTVMPAIYFDVALKVVSEVAHFIWVFVAQPAYHFMKHTGYEIFPTKCKNGSLYMHGGGSDQAKSKGTKALNRWRKLKLQQCLLHGYALLQQQKKLPDKRSIRHPTVAWPASRAQNGL